MNPEILENFLSAYIQTALWSSNDGEEPLDANFTDLDIAPETRSKMESDCQAFLEANQSAIEDAFKTGEVVYGPDFDHWGRAGHDFWLTRNGHGAGFWDGDWPEPFATRLTDASKAFGECDLYPGDDGRLYI